MKKLLLSLLISIYCFGNETEAPPMGRDAPPPPPNYQLHFPEREIQDSNKSFVGDDDLKQDNIEYGLGYESNVGKSYIKKVKDERGLEYFIDVRTGERITSFSSGPMGEELKEAIKEINLGYTPKDLEGIREKNQKIAAAKKARDKDLQEKEFNPKKFENMFLHDIDAPSRGTAILNKTLLNPNNLEDETKKAESLHYQTTFSYSQDKNLATTYTSTDNTSRLATAYKFLESYKAALAAKYSDNSIKCYISRELIPKYFCPMIGRENTLFGGDEKTEAGVGLKNCNNNCKDIKECREYKILENTDIEIENSNLVIYPYNNEVNFIKSQELSQKMMIDTMSYLIKVNKSSKFEGTDEEFEEFLDKTKIKVKFDLIKREDSVDNPPQALINGEEIEIRSSLMKKNIFVSTTTEFLVFKFYKPFISESSYSESTIHKKDWDMIESIEIVNITGQYKSENLFFCPFRQMVNNESECNLNEKDAEVFTIKYGSQVYHICTDATHKIGPDRFMGGFYSKETCESSCVESKECLPTYKHYSDFNTQDLFKATIGCVDSTDNTGCSIQKCEELLADNVLRPINEWVTYNDDTKKQTISNRMIDTKVLRPKFNLGDELNATADSYSELFQKEMKDAAYKYMMDNSSFNRVAYRIGVESPRRMSYTIADVNTRAKLYWNLKPASFDIENNVDYNLYVVMEIDQLYKPIAGLFLLDKKEVLLTPEDTESDLQFRDRTYAIKTGASADSWKTFKKVEFTNIRQVHSILRCEDGTFEIEEKGFWDNKILEEGCITYEETTWPETSHMNIDRNVFYNPVEDTFSTYDANAEKAEIFKTQKFSSDKIVHTYQLSTFLQDEIEKIPGGLIRNQESTNYGLSFKKIYNTNFMGTKVRGWPYNYKVYAFYSPKKLSYAEVLEELTKENLIYDKVNASIMSKNIDDDGELSNQIKLFTLGAPEMTTINMETTPFVNEEGSRVFKFMFLYDDENESGAQFGDYKIKGE